MRARPGRAVARGPNVPSFPGAHRSRTSRGLVVVAFLRQVRYTYTTRARVTQQNTPRHEPAHFSLLAPGDARLPHPKVAPDPAKAPRFVLDHFVAWGRGAAGVVRTGPGGARPC